MKHNWEYKKWEDTLKIINGKNQKGVENPNGIYPIYGSGGIMSYANAYLCPENCTIIGRKGNINNPIFVHTKFWNVDTAFGLCPFSCIVPRFLYYFCINYDFQKLNKQTTIPSLVKLDLLRIEIPVPPMNVQEQIVEELDKINEIISDCKDAIRNLDSLAQSLFYDYFGDHLANSKRWEVNRIGNVCLVQTGATPSRDNPDYFKGNIPWIKTTEVQNCEIRITEEHISEDALKNTNCKVFPIDTIIVAMYGQGKTRGQIAKLKIEACTNQACAAILPSRFLDSTFLYWFLFNSYESLRNLAVGGNQKNLNLSIIKNYKIILPPIDLQKKFAARIEQIEQQKKGMEETIVNMQTLLNSRMDYWFG